MMRRREDYFMIHAGELNKEKALHPPSASAGFFISSLSHSNCV
jgi:hypothetical protein